MHAQDKTAKFVNRSLAFLALSEVPQVAAQHWAGIFCFLCSFRRPLFAFAQEIFPFISSFNDDRYSFLKVHNVVRDEVLLGALLAPMSFTNFRAQIREKISISDASELAGAAAEATSFVDGLGVNASIAAEDLALNFLESAASVKPVSPILCAACGRVRAPPERWASCSVGCVANLCSPQCVFAHRKTCSLPSQICVDTCGPNLF